MSRLVVPGLDLGPEALELPAEPSRYVSRVLRLGPGDELTVLDGAGAAATAVLEEVGRTVRLRVTGRRAAAPEAGPHLHLVQALPKGDKLDEVVRKATELGATSIHPALSERSVARPEADRAAARAGRWRRIAAEATRQCGRPAVPQVAELLPLEAALRAARGQGPAVLLWEEERARGLGEVLSGHRGAREVALAIGPEGGLTAAEAEAARAFGYEPASLGRLVLRVETAAVVACALALHALGGLEP